ncbi:penicillin amidase, partial [Cardiosporidium cionae]
TSMTVSYVDSDDLFEVILTEDGKNYYYDEKILPLEINEELIYVKKEKSPRRVQVKRTHHGPLITSFSELKSFQFSSSSTHGIAFSSPLFRSDCGVKGITSFAAKNWEDFFKSIAGGSCIHLISTWADTAGNIGNFIVGGIPGRSSVRKSSIRDGSTHSDDWIEFLPDAAIPHYMNPKRASHNIRVEDFQRMQMDQFSINACDWKDLLLDKIFNSYVDSKGTSQTFSKPCENFSSVEISFGYQLRQKLESWDCIISPKNSFSSFMEAWIQITILRVFTDALLPKTVQDRLIGKI